MTEAPSGRWFQIERIALVIFSDSVDLSAKITRYSVLYLNASQIEVLRLSAVIVTAQTKRMINNRRPCEKALKHSNFIF